MDDQSRTQQSGEEYVMAYEFHGDDDDCDDYATLQPQCIVADGAWDCILGCLIILTLTPEFRIRTPRQGHSAIN